jgi:hypothetical protein
MKGIVYLIQPAELVGTFRYKIGCSRNTNLDRCKNGYKKGSRYLCIMDCNEPFILERKIKNKFTEKFTLIAGKEFYECDEDEENEVIDTFIDVIYEYRHNCNKNKLDELESDGDEMELDELDEMEDEMELDEMD